MKRLIKFAWLFFKRTPLGWLLRKAAPQWLVNRLEHLPLAVFANVLYGFPSRKITVVGVTGTDGKTTTTNMIHKILEDAGLKAAMVSTIGAKVGGKIYDTGFHVTSPHSITVQEFIKTAVRSGDKFIILEVTSHALDQFRFWGVKFHIGVVTNVTREHLDYHKTFEKYRSAKAKLLRGVRYAILNRDDKNFKYLEAFARQAGARVVSVSLRNKADLNLKRFPLRLKLPGDYNLSNALQAAAAAQALGVDNRSIRKSLESFAGLVGRMEYVANKKGLDIVIDYAHTPNGLKQALTALRQKKRGRLISLIGAEGFRDEGKREPMGQVSAELSDYTVITAVDPRGGLAEIDRQILAGCLKAGGILDESVFIVPDREEAIGFAVNRLAVRGDTVGIFGKGHEKSMNLDGKRELPWSDRQAVADSLRQSDP